MNRRSCLKCLTALTGALAALTSRLARVRLLAATLPQHRRAGHVRRRRRPVAADFQPPASKRQDIDLDDSWQFIRADVSGAEQIDFDDSAWSTIGVPHTWNNLDGEQHTNYYRGVGWYRRHYAVDAGLAGMNFYLQFDGANLATDVYVNGSFVGEHKGGYARFRF